ncbi:phosphatidate cytidylyltransferase [Microbacterium sp. No. 7]|uniref:phosphatidate cytidylyltransferase n=1 Tax=Microbacterium sp. No. 7 TaxID=1714373 RepID=UPI0006CFD79D|nr:phosphatidate cytidylyltransferase [Microbacterium sp. No. 7]ALJ20301.1 phosphatidate cytidylyltransferase [Microbacterium sp. No. 7]
MTSDSSDPDASRADDASPDDGKHDDATAHIDLPGHVRAVRSEIEHQIERARADFEHVNERINERSGRNLLMAIAIGLAIGIIVIASLIFIKELFLLFVVPVCLLGIFEFSRALQASGRRVDIVPQLVAALALLLTAYFLAADTAWVITFAVVTFVVVWRLIVQMASHDGRRYADVIADVLVAGFVQIYVTFMGSLALVLLRQEHGELWLLTIISVAVATDTGAYASGVMFGKHPMAPRISPKKTWEGFAGAAIASIAVATAMAALLLHLPWWTGPIVGAAILASATIGDLGESMIKRDLGIKDMSSWLPGHGGVLDRLDSLLLSMPAALALYIVLYPLTVA